MFRKLLALSLLGAVIFLAGKSWHLAKDGFSISRIQPQEILNISPLPFEEISQETSCLFDQNFYYLGRGHQCYAFVSEDGSYVLKFPRLDHFTIPFWRRALQGFGLKASNEKLQLEKKGRFAFLMNSFLIAKEELKEETGIIYLHLNKTGHLKKRVKIFDTIGRGYEIVLDHTSFILQKKSPLIWPIFLENLKKREKEKAKEILKAFLDVIITRAKKGIFNKDPSFLKNFGYDKGKAIQIDIGSFYKREEPNLFEASLQDTLYHVRVYLSEKDPELLLWLETEVEKGLLKENRG